MIVTPYGDPQAHGSIGRALSFIRRRGMVYARPYNIPYDPRTAGQLAQRQAFINAIAKWRALNSTSKDYYNQRAYGQPYTGYNLYLKADLEGLLPSTTPLTITIVNTASIGVTRGANHNSWAHNFWPVDWSTAFGFIMDNQNTWAGGTPWPAGKDLLIQVGTITETVNINLRDTITFTYNGSTVLTVFLPAMTGDNSLYVADDGSTYYDQAMTLLACSSKI